MFDFGFGMFAIVEIVIVIVMALIIGFAAIGWFPKVKVLRVGFMRPMLRKKIQPNWGDRCLLCGSPMSVSECPQCHVTRAAALDQVVYRYLSAHDGVLARSELASDLRVSVHEVNESIQRLTYAGRISPFHETQGGLVS